MEVDYLWFRIRQNDSQAFDLVFNMYYAQLCKFAYRILKNMPEAEETVQDAFVNLWIKRDKIEIRESLKSYLYQTVHNIAYNRIDLHKTRKSLPNNSTVNNDIWNHINNTYIVEDPLIQKLESEETRALINKAVDQLPEKCREIFRLSRYESLTYEEISEKLHLSPNTVRVQIFKALKAIQTYLNKTF